MNAYRELSKVAVVLQIWDVLRGACLLKRTLAE